MFYSIGFLIAIVIAGGVIAYVADGLGKKIGKKRTSIFGLRPRHTAALATVLFGMIVSVMTIFLVGIASAPVRQWIFHGAQALSDLNKTRDQLVIEKASVEQAKKELREVHGQEESLQAQNKTYLIQIGDNKKTVADQKAKIERSQKQIADVQGQITVLNEGIKKKDDQLRTNEGKLTVSTADLAARKRSITQLSAQLSKIMVASEKEFQSNEELKGKNGELLAKSKELLASIDVQQKEVASLTTLKQGLEKDKASLEADKAHLEAELRTDSLQLTEVTSKLEVAQKDNESLGAMDKFLRQDFVHTRIGLMTYKHFQEVTRISVPGGLTPEQADAAIESLVAQSQKEAAKRGASAQGEFKVADIIDRPDGTTTALEIKKQIRDKLVASHDPMVLIALASFNFYENEPVQLDVLVKPNPLVYHRGYVMQQANLNGGASDREIIRELVAFGASVRDKAERDQMIPRIGDDTFGSVSADKVYALVSNAKQLGHTVKLQAIVQSDTHAADPLNIEFQVR